MKYFKWHGIPVSIPETKKEWLLIVIPIVIIDLAFVILVILFFLR
jgi:hypothetical protein